MEKSSDKYGHPVCTASLRSDATHTGQTAIADWIAFRYGATLLHGDGDKGKYDGRCTRYYIMPDDITVMMVSVSWFGEATTKYSPRKAHDRALIIQSQVCTSH